MIVPKYLRFYSGYTNQSLMAEYAVTFFSLVDSMYRLQSEEMIRSINEIAVGNADSNSRTSIIKDIEKNSKGTRGILEEVRIVEKAKNSHNENIRK